MNKIFATTAALCMASTAVLAAAPTTATIITNDDVNAVLKAEPINDHTIRVVDMGQNYNMSIAVVSRGPTGGPPRALRQPS